MSVASSVADAIALQDHLGLQRCVHMGESGGGPYAAATAALHPDRVQQVVLVAGLAATHGKDKAHLRRSLNAMDRFSLQMVRWPTGAAWALNRVVKLVVDVSAEREWTWCLPTLR